MFALLIVGLNLIKGRGVCVQCNQHERTSRWVVDPWTNMAAGSGYMG